MDLSMPRSSDYNAYIHKKFGHVKRAREVDAVPDWQQGSSVPKPLVSPAHYFPYNFMAMAERSVTPVFADYINFAEQYKATSTPSRKRPCLNPAGPLAIHNSSTDSGNSSTTAVENATTKGEPLHYQFKRQLPPVSNLTQAPLEQSYIAESPVGADDAAGGLLAENISHTPVKRKYSYQNRRAIRTPTTTCPLRALAHENSATKNINEAITSGGSLEINASVIKSVLKATPVGTLELPAATTSNATPSANPMATAAVLTSISEDKLRSICTYHTNMVRKFPQKERTPKDQERRNKNTIACRMSRRVKKLEQIAVEEQCKQFDLEQWRMLEETLRATCLLEQLERLNLQGEDDEIEIDVVNVEGETSMVNVAGDMLGKLHTRPPIECQAFTIANILGN
ncbi:uncharacterized protein LOC110118688 [Ceratitis capitata]|uniref:uncharacterized protein LOC110118688 n=1 Tax=Ceratitis capitata TaxID=7213 RepID=UPI000A10974E|nr:uncharacterized protein LOC110118688 [Ceratitis capitata]